MKSIVLSQKAFASELFFAFTRERKYVFYDRDNIELEEVHIFSHATSHVFMIEFRVYNRNIQDWEIVYARGFSKDEKRLNSIEGSDITEFFVEEYMRMLFEYQQKAGYVDGDHKLQRKCDIPKFIVVKKAEAYSGDI